MPSRQNREDLVRKGLAEAGMGEKAPHHALHCTNTAKRSCSEHEQLEPDQLVLFDHQESCEVFMRK